MPPASTRRSSSARSAILRDKNAGKPDHVLQKIVESGLKSYYKEVTPPRAALRARSVEDGAQVLKEAEAKAGKPVALKGFVRYALGEGIEKEERRTSRPKSPRPPALKA